jgi:hypothetical protein
MQMMGSFFFRRATAGQTAQIVPFPSFLSQTLQNHPFPFSQRPHCGKQRSIR